MSGAASLTHDACLGHNRLPRIADMAEDKRRYSIVEGTPDEHADAMHKAYSPANRLHNNREILFFALIMLGVAGYAAYNAISSWLFGGP